MKKDAIDPWWDGLRCAQPIIIGYLPIAVLFGISSRTAGLGPWETVWMSMAIFAGASQFVLVGMLASGVSFIGALVATVGLNLRHIFYGPAIAPYMQKNGWRHFLLLAFGLTDEVFALSVVELPARNATDRHGWMFGLECGSYLAWLFGTMIGALGFQMVADLLPAVVPVLSFSLPCLFLVLLLPLLNESTAVSVVVAVSVSALFALAGMLTLGLMVGGLSGAVTGLFRRGGNVW